jgi:precorrin-6Y C5,15-methyltransferase (decarboxylating)
VVLTSGDPLFFGFGRLLLAELPAEQLTFHPSLSSVQLAFSRIKVPWQDAQIVSVHGRSLEELMPLLQQGAEKIAILTDAVNSPAAIAQLIDSLELPHTYQMWVCENLGGAEEQIHILPLPELSSREFAPLNVVILLRQAESEADVELTHSFRDRPGLMTKREVRILALGELALQSDQVVWDIGAGTGSVAIEIGRLCPTSTIYAIEKTAAGVGLITKNAQRFGVANVVPVSGAAPTACVDLPDPNRIFIGGSGGNLTAILDLAATRLATSGLMVLAIATFEHLSQVMSWLDSQNTQHCSWNHRLLQAQLSRSVPVGPLTRLSPLNPVTLVTLTRS